MFEGTGFEQEILKRSLLLLIKLQKGSTIEELTEIYKKGQDFPHFLSTLQETNGGEEENVEMDLPLLKTRL